MWRAHGSKLIRTFEFSGLPPPETTTALRIECVLSKYASGFVDTHLRFFLRPYLYLLPSPQPFEDHLVEPPFSVGLVADGSSGEMLVDGGVVRVSACSIEDEPDTAMLDVASTEDVALCVRAISSGKELTFTILGQPEASVRLRLRLHNDREFQQFYDGLRRAM